MVVVVVLEPPRKLRQDRLCIWAIMNVNIVPLERLTIDSAMPLDGGDRTGVKHGTRPIVLGEGDGVVSPVTAAVFRELLHRMRRLLIVKTPLDALEHQITDHLAGDAVGGRHPGHHLTIAGIECKGDTNALSVPAGDLEAVGRPAQVRADRDDLTVVRSAWRLSGIALQQEAVLRHQAVNAFVVQPGKSRVFTLPIEQCPDPAIPVGRPVIRQRSNRRQELGILRLLVSPSRATLHSEPSSSNDGKREISFFRAQPLPLPGGSRSPASSCPRPARVPGCVSQGL